MMNYLVAVVALGLICGGRYRNKFTPMLEELVRWGQILKRAC